MNEIARQVKGVIYCRGYNRLTRESASEFSLIFPKLLNPHIPAKNLLPGFSEALPHLIEMIWQEYAQLTSYVFYANDVNNDDDEFGLSGLENADCFSEETKDYLHGNVGFPEWAELSVDYVDTSESTPLREQWDRFDVIGRSQSMRLLKTFDAAPVDVFEKAEDLVKILQDDDRWYFGSEYVGWFDVAVTANLELIKDIQKERGFTYNALPDAEKCALIEIACNALREKDMQENKASHYLLSLLWNHPGTPDEGKARIALIADEYIIKIEN
jgi:hypothetical protein